MVWVADRKADQALAIHGGAGRGTITVMGIEEERNVRLFDQLAFEASTIAEEYVYSG